MHKKHILKAFGVFAITSTTAFADPVCSANMLRGLYAFQGDGAKTISSTQRNAVVSGTINITATNVTMTTTDTVYGSATNTTTNRTGTLLVGNKLFNNATSPDQINCRGLITLPAVTLPAPIGALGEAKINLVIFDGGNGFYLFNASTNELWTATAQKI